MGKLYNANLLPNNAAAVCWLRMSTGTYRWRKCVSNYLITVCSCKHTTAGLRIYFVVFFSMLKLTAFLDVNFWPLQRSSSFAIILI